jgi:hypothetical protein
MPPTSASTTPSAWQPTKAEGKTASRRPEPVSRPGTLSAGRGAHGCQRVQPLGRPPPNGYTSSQPPKPSAKSRAPFDFGMGPAGLAATGGLGRLGDGRACCRCWAGARSRPRRGRRRVSRRAPGTRRGENFHACGDHCGDNLAEGVLPLDRSAGGKGVVDVAAREVAAKPLALGSHFGISRPPSGESTQPVRPRVAQTPRFPGGAGWLAVPRPGRCHDLPGRRSFLFL